MTKSLQYVKVFETLQSAKGPVPVSTIKALDGIVPTRLSTYLWEIKKNTGFAVKANRDGRAVVSYELVGSGTAPVAKAPKAVAPKAVKAPKAAKAPKVVAPKDVKAKAKSKPMPVEADNIEDVMPQKAAGVVDVLDSIDTDITDFEDRSYAANYVRGVA